MSDEVCDLVLYDNYSQNLVLSMDERRSRQNMQAFVRLAEFLEKEVAFDRRFEGVAAGSELLERAARGRGLFRPELCKLLAYTKMFVYNKLMADPQVKGSRVDEALRAYFPKAVIEGYSQYLPEHPLRKEIAATYMTNRIIDQAGMTFYYNIWEDASYDVTQTTFGYLLVNELLDAARLKAELRGLEGSIGLEGIYQALIQIEDLLALLTRRVIRRSFDVFNPSSVREKLSSDFKALRGALPSVLPAESRAECEKRREAFIQAGLPTHLADEVAWFPELASGADIALLKTESGIDLAACAWLYHRVGVELGLRRALERASAQGAAGNDWWNKSAMSLLRAKLVDLQYQVSLQLARRANAAQGVEGLSAQLDAFKRERAPLLERVQAFERRLATAPSQGVAPMVILSSMLDELAQA
jgi:glutamate dehydrogenase